MEINSLFKSAYKIKCPFTVKELLNCCSSDIVFSIFGIQDTYTDNGVLYYNKWGANEWTSDGGYTSQIAQRYKDKDTDSYEYDLVVFNKNLLIPNKLEGLLPETLTDVVPEFKYEVKDIKVNLITKPELKVEEKQRVYNGKALTVKRYKLLTNIPTKFLLDELKEMNGCFYDQISKTFSITEDDINSDIDVCNITLDSNGCIQDIDVDYAYLPKILAHDIKEVPVCLHYYISSLTKINSPSKNKTDEYTEYLNKVYAPYLMFTNNEKVPEPSYIVNEVINLRNYLYNSFPKKVYTFDTLPKKYQDILSKGN